MNTHNLPCNSMQSPLHYCMNKSLFMQRTSLNHIWWPPGRSNRLWVWGHFILHGSPRWKCTVAGWGDWSVSTTSGQKKPKEWAAFREQWSVLDTSSIPLLMHRWTSLQTLARESRRVEAPEEAQSSMDRKAGSTLSWKESNGPTEKQIWSRKISSCSNPHSSSDFILFCSK